MQIYDDKLQLLNSMPWGKNSGVPALLTYNPKQDEVITAGLGGVKVRHLLLAEKCGLINDGNRKRRNIPLQISESCIRPKNLHKG